MVLIHRPAPAARPALFSRLYISYMCYLLQPVGRRDEYDLERAYQIVRTAASLMQDICEEILEGDNCCESKTTPEGITAIRFPAFVINVVIGARWRVSICRHTSIISQDNTSYHIPSSTSAITVVLYISTEPKR
jgi:hypothetical protein